MDVYTRQDRTRNECSREIVGVAPIVKKMIKTCSRLFDHVRRRPTEVPIRKLDQVEDRPVVRGRETKRKL